MWYCMVCFVWSGTIRYDKYIVNNDDITFLFHVFVYTSWFRRAEAAPAKGKIEKNSQGTFSYGEDSEGTPLCVGEGVGSCHAYVVPQVAVSHAQACSVLTVVPGSFGPVSLIIYV